MVKGVHVRNGKLTNGDVKIKDEQGVLRGDTIPKVTIVKSARWSQKSSAANPDHEPGIMTTIEKSLKENPLAGFVAEGLAPYGALNQTQERALADAAFSGMPTVRVGRGNAGGMTAIRPWDVIIEVNNLTACLMKFGSLPLAKNPRKPTFKERKATQAMVAKYQQILNRH